ncbi:MAG: ribosome silencing factor [Polyangiaceae bacterium]|nr:ribosome silencing factor [Polyangiaceae bacterium]MCW5791110.1 ribosome silencing factor [Polyangiaceae bacterium]
MTSPKAELPRPSRPPAPAAKAASPEQSERIARWVAEAGLDKKAMDVQVIDVVGKVDYADFLVLMTGQSDRHVAAIAAGVEQDLAERGVRPMSVEGLPRGEWALIDFVDVVVHVFQEGARSVYDLDGLWLDARRVALPTSA